MDRNAKRKIAAQTRKAPVTFAGIVAATMALALSGCSRVSTQAQPNAVAPPSVTYIGQWGVKGTGPGQMSDPVDIATDSVGDAYIVDGDTRFVEKFDPHGTPLLAFDEGNLKHPQAITVDIGGAIYVTDSGRGSAICFLPSGDRYKELHLKTHPSAEDKVDIAVEDDGTIDILDTDAAKMFTYNPRFALVRAWVPTADGPSPQVRPKAVANGFDGSVYIADTAGNRILRYSSDGHFSGALNTTADGAAWRISDRIAVSRGFVFAMDANGRMLHVFSTDGHPVLDADLATELGQAGRSAPALAVSPRRELLVLDTPQTRVLRYRLNF